jgi:hypothetical protein
MWVLRATNNDEAFAIETMNRQLLLETIQSANLGNIISGTLPGNREY